MHPSSSSFAGRKRIQYMREAPVGSEFRFLTETWQARPGRTAIGPESYGASEDAAGLRARGCAGAATSSPTTHGERPLFDVQTNAIGLGPRSDIPAIRLLLECPPWFRSLSIAGRAHRFA